MADAFAGSVSGASQLAAVGLLLKRTARGDLRRELLRGLRTATAPAKVVVPASARSTLPRRGGLAESVARQIHLSSRNSLSGSNAYVTVVLIDPPAHDVKSLNQGRLSHPVFGHRSTWRKQSVRPLFFTAPMVALRPVAQRELLRAMDRTLVQLINE